MAQNSKPQLSPQVLDTYTVLTGIVRGLVPLDAGFQIDVACDAASTLFTVTVPARELAEFAGAGGRIVRSLQAILSALAIRHGQRMVLDVRASPSPKAESRGWAL